MSRLKLLAKCKAPVPRDYPPTSGLCLRRAPIQGRWIIEKTTRGRTEAISVTSEELAQLVLEGTQLLNAEIGR